MTMILRYEEREYRTVARESCNIAAKLRVILSYGEWVLTAPFDRAITILRISMHNPARAKLLIRQERFPVAFDVRRKIVRFRHRV